MRIGEILRLVMMNLKQNKFKVLLTSLGVIVGTATIVMVIAIGEGGQKDVEEQFKTLNAGTITVSMGSDDPFAMMGGMMPGGGGGGGGAAPTAGGGGGTTGGRQSSGGSTSRPGVEDMNLTQEMLNEILLFVPDIVSGAITAEVDADVIGGELEEAISYTVVGTESSYASISNLAPLVGSFITDEEEENETRSVVLGYDVAVEIFGSAQYAYDSKIEIDGRSYVVNGVLQAMGTVVSGINPDTSVFMPYTTADKYLFGPDTQPQFSLLATDMGMVPTVMENIQLVLAQSNPNQSYLVEDAGATMDAAMQSANTLSLLLLAVAAIVFIVGGIGIMNVLFVSVKERTSEIGVLKALGTRKRDILMLFLMEAGMIGLLGGLLGIGASFGAYALMQTGDITLVLTPSSFVLAFGFAVVTGTVFGFYPAFKASGLLPIEALNQE